MTYSPVAELDFRQTLFCDITYVLWLFLIYYVLLMILQSGIKLAPLVIILCI